MNAMEIKHRVVMFPWLAIGHITPFVELAKKLIRRNFFVYICTTQVNINEFMPKIPKESLELIQFVEIHLPSLPDLPPSQHTTKGLPPHLMNTLTEALYMAKDDFHRILETLKPDLVMYDYMQPYAPQVASSLSIPAVVFLTTSAAILCYIIFLVKKRGQAFPYPELCPRVKLSGRSQTNNSSSVKHGTAQLDAFERSCEVILVNSLSNMDAKYIELLSSLLKKKVIPVGPLVQGLNPAKDGSNKADFIIEWIDKKEQASVLYVSFGSECFLTREEMEPLAKGLELSNVNFIWVVRFPVRSKTSLEEALPEDFITRVGERGLIVEDWAPQARILGHPNTGGFLSHCGWNSLLESMRFGVPVVAFPMHLDQPINARLVEENGFGIEVQREENGMCHEEELSRVIRKVMVEESGEDVRQKARALKDTMKKVMEEENVIDEAVKELVHLIQVKNKN